jgi:antitoxin component YwqK of YwqJK toxin-antitoxin module
MRLHRTVTIVLAAAAAALLTLSSCSKPKEVDYAKLKMVNNLLTDPETRKPFTGISRDYHPDGKLKSEFPIKDGVFHGTVKEWYANGKPYAETEWVKGERTGRNMEWTESGLPYQERVYEKDRIVSEKKFETGK